MALGGSICTFKKPETSPHCQFSLETNSPNLMLANFSRFAQLLGAASALSQKPETQKHNLFFTLLLTPPLFSPNQSCFVAMLVKLQPVLHKLGVLKLSPTRSSIWLKQPMSMTFMYRTPSVRIALPFTAARSLIETVNFC